MNSRPSVLFYCQHALGMGHLVRSLELAAGLAERFRVVLLNGGPLPSGLRIHPEVEIVDLPPLGFDSEMRLVSRDRRRKPERAQHLRREIILKTYSALRPQVVLTELFPFGRKKFTNELLPMLEEARTATSRPVIACSLRDILVRREPRDDDRSTDIANRYFDAVLVHSDPSFARLDESLRTQNPLRVPVYYTGFVTAEATASPRPARRKRKLVVSAGGGLVGESLLRVCIEAHALLAPGESLDMEVVAGPFLPEGAWKSLRALAKGRKSLSLRRFVPNLSQELKLAAASISQCGYNTSMDILCSGVPALVVPFAEGGESEQMERARRLVRAGAVRILHSNELHPQRMANEIRSLLRFKPRRLSLDFAGKQNSAAILDEIVSRHGTAERPTCSQTPRPLEVRQ